MSGPGWLGFLLSVVLLLLYLRAHLEGRRIRRELAYLAEGLRESPKESGGPAQRRIHLVTPDPAVRELLLAVNGLLDRVQQSATEYVKTKQAMRMMLSNVSHDLKTPLTVIQGYAEMLERNAGLSEDERRRMLGQVHKKTQEVQELIHAFFDLTRLEADDLELPLSMVDVCEVCRHRILAYYDILTNRKIEVDIRLPEEPVWLYTNEEGLSRILDNLLSNAVRYGGEGGYLGLSLSSGDGQVRIEVADRGRGIGAREQALVFERMYTLEDSRNRNMQGSGLGLAIAKRLTERLGGRIGLESIPWKHTRFSLVFTASSNQGHPNRRGK